MKACNFLLVALYMVACGHQHIEPQGNTQYWRTVTRVIAGKPKPANKFIQDILSNSKLLADSSKLGQVIKAYVKRGGALNIELDAQGNTMLTKALQHRQEKLARQLLAHNASKNKALRTMLDLGSASPTPISQNWPIISWLIEKGASKKLLDQYMQAAMTGAGFSGDGMQQAIKLGANTEQAFDLALQHKKGKELALLLDYVDEQQAIDKALQTNDHDIIEVYLKMKLDRNIKNNIDNKYKDFEKLLVKALHEDNKDLKRLATSYHREIETSVFANALQTKDYETLALVIKEVPQYQIQERLLKVFQTKEPKIADLVLERLGNNKESYLDHLLGQYVLRENYDMTELIVKKGGNADIVLDVYLNEIHKKSVRAEFDFERTWNIVKLGADPQKRNLEVKTWRVMRSMVEEGAMAKDIEVLEFLFANMDKETIAAMGDGQRLLHTLIETQQTAKKRAKHFAELTNRSGTKTSLPQSEQDLIVVRDKLIDLLKEHDVTLGKH